MIRTISTFILYLLLILSIGFAFAIWRYPEAGLYVKQLLGIAPCQKPLQYSIGSFDEKFGIIKADFLGDIEKAEVVWEKVLNKNLFQYDPEAKLKINLTYDYRQDATDKLRELGLNIENTKDSYDKIRDEYEKRLTSYSVNSSTLNRLVLEFKSQKEKYDSDVRHWNSRGGAPKNVYDSFVIERERLENLVQKINNLESLLNKEARELNGIINVLNQIASQINIGVKTYNKIGESAGEEFSEGVYISDVTGKRIDIFQFNDRAQLVRLLSHEFGHAIGMNHIDDPEAIMYRLNEAESLTPTADDIAELKSVCNID